MDGLNQYVCQEGSEKYYEAVNLNDIQSSNDPETDPFKSKYQAREKWMNIKNEIEEQLQECAPERQPSLGTFLLAVLHFRIGTNFTETEELSSGEDHLIKCIELIQPWRLNEKACNTLQAAYNQMGILWSTRRQPEKALDYLKKAEQLYLDYKQEVGNAPYQTEELFDDKIAEDEGIKVQKRCDHFEHYFTLTQYYLAQVYEKLEENEKSANYCHATLRRQLETKTYEPLDWALNAATLSQFYMTVDKLTLARHCLASSQRILLETGEPLLTVSVDSEDSQTDVDHKEKIPRCWADLYRCWIKYGLSLLETSMTRLIANVKSDDVLDDHNADKKSVNDNCSEGASNQVKGNDAVAKAEAFEHQQNEEGKTKDSEFFDLELTSIEEEITDRYVCVFEEARPIFLKIQQWINEAKKFYLLDGHCTDHVELIQDHSRAFKLLAFFELDFERQCKMHKRRIDMLEAILKELSTQFYLMICRQLMYEIAEIYSAMLDLKLAIIENVGATPTPHAVKKINHLAEQSISEYQRYIDTLKSGSDKVLPEQFSSDDERPALVAFFCMGRLHSKFLEFDVNKKLENMKNSRDCYKFLVEYCRRNPSAKNVVGSEFEICEEMVTLMPVKMEKMRMQMM